MRLARFYSVALSTLGLLALSPHPSAVAPLTHRPVVMVGANQSGNWSGYNQGSIEQGGKLFRQVSGVWTVPKATQHKSGEAEYSATWVGIGGGCVDANCTVTDSTLIQAGTSQDVSQSGKASYFAWWEIIPAPSIRIASFPIAAGNRVYVDIASPADGAWTISVKNLSTGRVWTQATAYSSSEATAEWIEETPVVLSNSGHVTIGPMPELTGVHFDHAMTNGSPAALRASEELQLVDPTSGAVLATPSAPDSDSDGFNDCTYAASCPVPSS